MENYPYQKDWEEQKDYRGLGCIGVIVIILAVVFLRDYDWFNRYAPYVILSLILFSGIFSAFYDTSWKCPRCKRDFFPKRGIGAWSNEYCISCKLPIYYGSTFFLDYWGNEKAKELIEKNKEQGGKI